MAPRPSPDKALGVPSLGSNFADLPSERSDRDTSQAVVIPVPYEGTSELLGGVSQGPQAIIEASRLLEDFDSDLGMETSALGIHTLPPLQVQSVSVEQMVDRVRETALALSGRLLVALGGEHSLTVGMVSALLWRYPRLSVLVLDAHADLRDEYLGQQLSHACALRRVAELCPAVLVGVRSLSREEADFLARKGEGIRVFSAQDYLLRETLSEVISALGDPVYVSIDLDVLDPSLLPAVTHPVPGGLGWEATLRLLGAVARERQVVGFDVVELASELGPPSCAAVAAHLIYKFIGLILARSAGCP